MKAIIKKEFLSLFRNVTGWLFLGVLLATYGFYFLGYNLTLGYPLVNYTLSAVMIVFMLVTPILTMRVISEERHTKTDQLLLTAPISPAKIIIGKYIALAAVFTIAVAVMAISPLMLSMFGEVYFLQNYTCILGIWLFGLACIAVGFLASSCTENQVISAVLGFGALFVLYMMPVVTSLLGDNVVTTVLGCLDLYTPLTTMLNGIFSLTTILYYITFVVVCLFLSYELMQKRRWTVSKANVTTSAFSVVTIVVVIAVAVLANVGLSYVPDTYTELDASGNSLYSITDDTKDYLATLEDDITIYVFAAESDCDTNIDATLQHYKDASKHITITYVDPTEDLTFEGNYSEDGITDNSLIIESSKKYKIIDYYDIYQYSFDYSSYSYYIDAYDCEGQVTAAIQAVLSDQEVVIYELDGHNETSITGDFLEVFEKNFYTVETLTLLNVDEVPEDCEMLIIFAPCTDLSEDDLAKLEAYVDAGGKILFNIYYEYWDDLENFQELLAYYGVTTTSSVVVENDSQYYMAGYVYYLLPYVESTSYTSNITGNSQVVLPYALGFYYDEDNEDYDYTQFLSSSDDSYVYPTSEDGTITEEGSVALGLAVENENGGCLVLLGSPYAFLDTYNSYVSGRNATLFKNIVSILVGDEETTSYVVIAAKSYSVTYLTVSTKMILVYGYLWGLLIPVASIFAGIIIWAIRRRK